MRTFVLIVFLLLSFTVSAQLLQWSPSFIKESSSTVTITCDATKGNQGLLNYTPTNDVYVHIGVITNLSTGSADWKHVVNASFNTPAAIVKATAGAPNTWIFTISGGLRSFFGITDVNEKIQKIAILFRSGDGSKKLANVDGTDMYIPVYDDGLSVRLDSPLMVPYYKPSPQTISAVIGDKIRIAANSSKSATLKAYFNGTELISVSNATAINTEATITSAGTQTIIAEANDGLTSAKDTISFLVTGSVNVAALPAGLRDGVNYLPGDNSVYLVLYAPGKTTVSVIGDFNNWTESLASQLNRTPDGNRFWIQLTGLTPGTEYAYQYVVDKSIKIADYLTEKILDPNNDQYIPSNTYPNLKAYPVGKTTGIVSILQTAKPVYNWQVTNFARPDKKNLVVYELLLRDFVATQNFKSLKDTLSYLKRLGVNAIELMPFSEFEGNLSWGYNPNFFFAPDKYYGTETDIKQFIDACHAQGMAVIMDMVLNHCMGSAPLAQLYWNAATNKPATDNPWLNVDAKHPFNVGNDFNHESSATKDFVAKVVRHWLTNYKIDGFRWDLSKGFTQTDNPSNVGAWGNYDASRVAIWKRIYDTMQAVSPNSISILEHFGGNTEEAELASYGMLLWGNLNYQFGQASMGIASGSDFSGAMYKSRGFTVPHLITYQESHDEERMMYRNLNYGLSSGTYSIKDSATALKRQELTAAFWALLPGPKMLWQFGELGYPYSINTCSDASVNNACRLESKPIKWDYQNNLNRKALYNVYSKLFKLKLTPNYASTFSTGTVSSDLVGLVKWMNIIDDSLKVVVLGNFDIVPQTFSYTFPATGNWYSYFSNNTKLAVGIAESFTLQPGEYQVYTSKNINNNTVTAIGNNNLIDIPVSITPNPVKDAAIINYQLPLSGTVSISLRDLHGKNLGNLFSGFKPAGKQQFLFKLSQLKQAATNGLYLVHINYNNQTKVEKIMLMK